MYICICKQVTDRDIQRAVENGACSMRELRAQLGVATQCGECKTCARQTLRDIRKDSTTTTILPAKPVIELASPTA